MSQAPEDPPNDKSLNRILEINLDDSPASREARLLGEKREKLIQEIEKHSPVRTLRDQLALLDENSVLKHSREAASLFEESPAMRAAREQLRQLEQSSSLVRARFLEENSVVSRALEAFKSHDELARMAMGPCGS